MPTWPHPESPCLARAVAAHEEAFGEVTATASAPATWLLIGEHTDHFGGIVVVGMHAAQLAVAISPRADATFVVDEHTIAEDFAGYDTSRSTAEGFDVHEQAHGPAENAAARLAGLVHTMMHRQLVSRETAGFNVTIVSDIPRRAGLGEQVAADVAAALAFATSVEELDSPPVRAKLADVCYQSSQAFSPTPQVRARYAAALRGQAGALQVIDYADGSITQAPQPFGEATGLSAFVIIPPSATAFTGELVATRAAFIDKAAAAFGAESLRLLPDASTRVIDWLRAVHEVLGPEEVPSVEEASAWMQFMDLEIAAAAKATVALRSRKIAELVPLLQASSVNLGTLLGLGHDTAAVQQLCQVRGAVLTRAAEAGSCGSVIAVVPSHRAANFAADLSADGLGVIALSDD